MDIDLGGRVALLPTVNMSLALRPPFPSAGEGGMSPYEEQRGATIAFNNAFLALIEQLSTQDMTIMEDSDVQKKVVVR